MSDIDTERLAADVLAACRARGLMTVTAESCTGGLVSAALTAIAGSSDVVDRGFITYTNEAKREMLGVPAQTLEAHGAVSQETAAAMAAGALARSRAQVAVSVTGIAGPGGATPGKPVGLVHFAAQRGERVILREERFGAIGREAVRKASVRVALGLLLDLATESAQAAGDAPDRP
ncbi:MAG: CinA family protein [Phreatobacter sp.]|uniref:CinA family protein n=1 Tax=Phreatobacter sp. TaxID=1966341 RepID=UPI0027374802|nr:CinA family protein [Phreatobacter sp.]MDP2801068.1 CinA family protein [Phreatobacter sp.]